MMMQHFSVASCEQKIPVYRLIRQRVKVRGDIIVLMKTYFDGTGNTQSRFMGLASIAAPLEAWEMFETGWKDVLARHHAPALHMTDLNVARGAFKGWEFDRRIALLNELLGVLSRLLRTPHVCPRMALVTVDAHRSATSAYPGVIPSIPCLCVFWCLDQLCNFYPVTEHFEMLFDRNEPFFHPVHRYWQKQAFAKRHALLNRIDTLQIGGIDALLPMQAVDLFAWEIHRYWRTWDTPQYMRSPAFGGIEAELLLLSTQNRRWEYDDLEYLAQCRMSSDETVRQEVERYALCQGCRTDLRRKT
jgi:hypothetical protein